VRRALRGFLVIAVGSALIAGCGDSDSESGSPKLPALADSIAEAWYADELSEEGEGGVVDPPPRVAYCQSEEICKVKLRGTTLSLHVDLKGEEGCWSAVSVVIGGGGEPIDAPFEGCVDDDASAEEGLFAPAEDEGCRTGEGEIAEGCLAFIAENAE